MGTYKKMNLDVWSYIWLRWKSLFGVKDSARLQYFLNYESKDEAQIIALAKTLQGYDIEIYRTGLFRKKWHVWAVSKKDIEVTHDSFARLIQALTKQARVYRCQLTGYSARFKGAI